MFYDIADVYVEIGIYFHFKEYVLHWILAVGVRFKTTEYWRLECEMSC